MITCTEDDNDFVLYEDKVKCRKIKFTIKQIFIDWWDKFLLEHPNISIRDIVFSSVEKVITCKTILAGYTLFLCSTCSNKRFVYHTCKS